MRYLYAAHQDENPIIALTHFNYAVIMLETALGLQTRPRILNVTGVEIDAAIEEANVGQDRLARSLLGL
jgi:hypothetical protein